MFAVVVIAAPIGLRVYQQLKYARQRILGAELVESLRDRRPDEVPSQRWQDATGWAITAYHNVCFSEEHVSINQLVLFNRDARSELAGEVSLQSIDWVWARLAETGPHGKRYVSQWEPEYRSLVYRDLVPDGSP